MGHTQGPWIGQITSGNQGLIYSELTGENIAVTYKPDNMNIIEAAPDLLEACEQIIKDVTTALLYKRINKRVAEDISNTLQQVISKAKGETK